MDPIIFKIEISATPELLKVLDGFMKTLMDKKSQSVKPAEITQEVITDRVKELIASGQKKEVTKLLKEFGVSKVRDIDPSDYGDFFRESYNLS